MTVHLLHYVPVHQLPAVLSQAVRVCYILQSLATPYLSAGLCYASCEYPATATVLPQAAISVLLPGQLAAE